MIPFQLLADFVEDGEFCFIIELIKYEKSQGPEYYWNIIV